MTYHYEGGIVDFVKYLNSRKERGRPPLRDRHRGRGTGELLSVEVAMQWNTSYSEGVYSFANTIHARGRHPRGGLCAALTGLINRYARDKKRAAREGRQPHG
ncbi:hypothetical protein [Streptomyces sp. KL116D]|uniref:hypothetical protein n=1 Tax=Streptomyces sp. KL116D TaxID=3045152 RepID=UPI0035571EDA